MSARALGKLAAGALLLAALALTGGCKRNVVIDPDPQRLPVASGERSADTVAYVMTAAQRDLVVTTPGGGGDKVSYRLYRDLESALYRVLGNRFQKVLTMPAADDAAFVADKGIRFIFTPAFQTTSSSKSAFTWPPTEFSVTIDIVAKNAQGATVWQDKVTGNGQATFDEFKRDFGLAGRRAAQDAFAKLDAALKAFPADAR